MTKKDDIKFPVGRYVKPGTYRGTIKSPSPISKKKLLSDMFQVDNVEQAIADSKREEDEWAERVALIVEGSMEDAPDRSPPKPPPKPFDPNNIYEVINSGRLDKLPSRLVEFTRDISMNPVQTIYSFGTNFGRPVDYVPGYAAPAQDKLTVTMNCCKCRMIVKVDASLDVVATRGATILDFFQDLLGPKGCLNCSSYPEGRLITRCIYSWKVVG